MVTKPGCLSRGRDPIGDLSGRIRLIIIQNVVRYRFVMYIELLCNVPCSYPPFGLCILDLFDSTHCSATLTGHEMLLERFAYIGAIMLTSDQLLSCHLALYGNAKDDSVTVVTMQKQN